ncbi:YadA-like family protein [Mitsuokella multacida]|uniref:YadA-like family protein n=1 Tax=Mitsuokella multacida TaxID=52226 RepID=UPI0022E841E9|nr:YadA-like family protein [Mitsuokella multacida]
MVTGNLHTSFYTPVVLNGKPDIQRASVAIGYGASADNGNIAIGSYSDASTDLRTATTTDGNEIKSYLTDTKADSYVSVGKTGALRRISNVADGAADSDVATIHQLKALSDKAGVYNEGWGIKIGDYTKKDAAGNETTVKNAISVDRNLGNNSTSVTQVSNTGLILGGDFSGTDQPDEKYGNYGATGQYAVTLGGRSNRASGESSVAAGGMDNTADGNKAFVGGGYRNTASGDRSSAIGGSYNTASGLESSAIGGGKNIASEWKSSAFGGIDNISLSRGSSTLGGMNSVVLGDYATGIAGGSTGDASNALAAGSESVVTVRNGTAIGYQATTNEDGTIAFGHDRGDVSGYTVTWQQRTDKDSSGNIVKNADGTTNDYTKAPKSVTATTYDSAAYNRLVKVADGVEDHDVVVMEQLKKASGVGNNIKVYKTDENNKPIEDTSDAAKTAQNGSKDAWGLALGAGTFTTGTSDKATDASTSDQLVTGTTLYDYDKPTGSQNYVNVNNTTGQNLSALDAQVKANADELDKPNHNIKFYNVDDKILKYLPKVGTYSSNEANDGANGMGSMAAGVFTHSDGIASTVAGSYSGVVGTGFQGATALSYGTFNVNQNAAQAGKFSGVANSIVGQANVTTDSNAAIIYGAGNTVKNSYRDIDTKNASEIRAAAGSGDVTKLGEALQKAVPTSGGQVMVMGGGNSVDKAYMTQVTGVGNKVTGTQTWSDEEKADNSGVTQLNFIDGFYSSLENGHNDYMIGAYNKLKDSDSTIIFGDNNGQKFFASSNDSKPQKDNINFVNVKDSIAIGSNNNFISKADKAHGSLEDVVAVGNNNTVSGSSHAIAIGDQNTIHNGEAWQGDPKSINSSGNVAIGYNTKIWYDATYGSDGESIVIGKNASAYNPVGTLEKTFNFGNEDLKNQKSGFTGSIAIGENAFARSGSTTIGVHRYKGTLGDINVDPTSTPSGYSGNNGVGNSMLSSNATTVGNETYNNGVFSTAMGSYTSLSGLYSHQKWGEKYYGLQNFGAAVIGSLDSVESLTSTQGTAGMADSILGSANRTQNANGTVMVGAGNVVTNSAVEFGADEIKTAGSENPNNLSEAMRTSIKNANGGGAASVIGNGNIVDSSTSVSVVGAKNEVYNTRNAQILASNRTIGTKTPDTTSTGDATIEVKAVENSVIIGSASVDSPVTTTKSNVTILGYNANAEVDNGVALGSESVARTGAGDAGYDPTTGRGSRDNSIAWTATRAAVSIGNTDEKVTDKVTRQLTGLAAGTNDTDAVNVAQLRKLGDNTVQYDLNTDKGKITLAGKSGTTITNVKSALDGAKDANGNTATIATATGDDLKNAANLGDLQKVYNDVNAKADKASTSHTALTVEGGTPAGKDDATNKDVYAGKNILLHESTDANGKVTYDLKLAKDITIGKPGKDGEDGKIGIDGKDGHIGLNGSDGITVRGLDGKDGAPGKDGVTITGPKGEAGKDGIDGKVGISGKDGNDAVSISGKDGVGHIGLTGPAGTNGKDGTNAIDITVKNGYDGANGVNGKNGVDGTSLTRIVYTDGTGEHQVATLEDGLKFKGDDTTIIAKKLNNTLDIIGGADSKNLTEKNIGVNSDKDGRLNVQLAKDLKGITSISNQTTTKDGDKEVTTGAKITLGTDGSVDVNKGKITNVGSGIEKDGEGNITDTSKTNAANIGDVQNIVNDAKTELTNGANGLNKKANIDASNIGANLKGADGKTAATDAEKIKNENAWGSAIGTGKIEKDNGQLVTGKTVYEYNKPIAENGKELNYVSEKKTTGQNLGALDSQVKTNADNIAKNTESIQDITNNMKNLGDNAVQYDKDSNKSKVTLGGKDGTVITNVKDGALRENSTDAVNGKQLYNEQQAREAADKAITEKVTNNTSEITKIKNGDFTDASKTAIHNIAKNAVEVVDGINTKAVKIEEGTDTTPTKYAVNVEGKGKVASGDTGLISGDTLYKEVHIDKDGAYIKGSNTVGQNLSNLDTGLKTTSDLIHTNTKGDTIQIGGNSTATKIDISGKDKDGKSTGRVITGIVSDASDPNSAANVGYVNGITSASNEQIYHDMNMQYNHVENDISRAAAGSNALAALHPMQEFDPDDKAQFALGYGHYRNSNAGAVGAFYQPDENSMVNFGVSFGNGDAGINAGVTFKFGPGGSGHHALTKTQMAKVIDAQSKEIDELKKDNADKDKRIDALEQKMTEILAKLDKSKD